MRNKEEIEQIIKTKESGYSYDEISKMFGVNKSSIAFYCNEKKKSILLVKYQKQKENKNTRACLQCGKTFIRKNNQKFCCVECYKKI